MQTKVIFEQRMERKKTEANPNKNRPASWKEFKLRLMLKYGSKFSKTSTISYKVTKYMREDLGHEDITQHLIEQDFDWCGEILACLQYDTILKCYFCEEGKENRFYYEYQRRKLVNDIIQVLDTEYALITTVLWWLPITMLSILLNEFVLKLF